MPISEEGNCWGISIICTTFRKLLCRSPNYIKKLINYNCSCCKKACTSVALAPVGCFTVYVGSEKKRFVVKTGHTNNPMFQRLLEEAACEYGFQRDGPILLPCKIDLFSRVMAEIDDCSSDDDDEEEIAAGGSRHYGIGGKAYVSSCTRTSRANRLQDGPCYSRLTTPIEIPPAQ